MVAGENVKIDDGEASGFGVFVVGLEIGIEVQTSVPGFDDSEFVSFSGEALPLREAEMELW